MGALTYLAVLGGCLAAALWLEPVLRVGVLRQRRRLALTLIPVAAGFLAWDLAAVAAGHWSFDERQTIGVRLPGGLPLEEVLFFVVVPLCAVLGFEAVRTVIALGAAPPRGRGRALVVLRLARAGLTRRPDQAAPRGRRVPR